MDRKHPKIFWLSICLLSLLYSSSINGTLTEKKSIESESYPYQEKIISYSTDESEALIGSYKGQTILAADFWPEDGSLDAWRTEKGNGADSQKKVEDTLDDSFEYDLFDGFIENDVRTGKDTTAEKNYWNNYYPKPSIKAGAFTPPFRPKLGDSSKTKTKFAPGLISDTYSSERDRQIAADPRASVKAKERLNRWYKRIINKNKIGVAIKDNLPFYHPFGQVRDKYYHAWVVDENLPEGLSKTQLKKIQKEKDYYERLNMLRTDKRIKEQDLAILSGFLREHLINPDTKIVRGTLGANRELRRDLKRVEKPSLPRVLKLDGYLVYNEKTKIAAFYDLKDRNLRTFQSISNRKDFDDVRKNHNLN